MLKSRNSLLIGRVDAPFRIVFVAAKNLFFLIHLNKKYHIQNLLYFTSITLTDQDSMNFKIDTKEKFTVIKPEDTVLSANMTEEINTVFSSYLSKPVPHIVLNLSLVDSLEPEVAETISAIQQEFYEKNCSFIVCEMKEAVENSFDSLELLEFMNVTPTESEAWDIVQMEEIEREIMGDFDENDNTN
jgi:anti-anti-sigma regulatory factor